MAAGAGVAGMLGRSYLRVRYITVDFQFNLLPVREGKYRVTVLRPIELESFMATPSSQTEDRWRALHYIRLRLPASQTFKVEW